MINKSPPCFLYIDIGLMIFQFIVTAYEVRANYPQAGVFLIFPELLSPEDLCHVLFIR